MNKATIVIPCFNLGAFLADAVDSAQRQTYPAREIIVVDDGSTDAQTLEVLDQCRRLGVQVHQTENRGVAAARNFGIERATTPYIFCLDADDIAQPTYLAETVPLLDADHEAGMVTTYVEFFGDASGVWQTPEYDPARMLWENCVCGCSLFRKECWEQVGGYRQMPANEDWDFWIAVVERGWKWAVVPKPLYRYRKRSQSRSEYEQGNRDSLFRSLVAAHGDFYRACAADVVLGMDAQLADVGRRLQLFIRDSEIQTQHIRKLEDAILQREERLRALRHRLQTHPAASLLAELGQPEPTPEPRSERVTAPTPEHARLIEDVQCVVHNETAPDSIVLVASRGDDELLRFDDRVGWHFPRAEDGRYAGHYPADSAGAIAHLEDLRGRGAEYLIFPAPALWWLEHYAEFNSYLETRCEVLSRTDQGAVVSLNTRLEMPHNTFSVVICTYKRADYVGQAIESVFAQDYPQDKYEVIVINNDSPDHTEQVVAKYLHGSPVPISYFVEKRNGLSYARNLGIEKARFDYVVHLDDDAAAVPSWLASFNAVINEQHALVVGGRVDIALPADFEAPEWFN
jgi:glycosyltransferase involved in cell wall biosynthesis